MREAERFGAEGSQIMSDIRVCEFVSDGYGERLLHADSGFVIDRLEAHANRESVKRMVATHLSRHYGCDVEVRLPTR